MAGDGQGRDTRRWRPSGAVLGIIRHLTGRLRKDAKCASDSMYRGAYHSCACVVLMQEWATGVCWKPPVPARWSPSGGCKVKLRSLGLLACEACGDAAWACVGCGGSGGGTAVMEASAAGTDLRRPRTHRCATNNMLLESFFASILIL
jgi:hypothetical protein